VTTTPVKPTQAMTMQLLVSQSPSDPRSVSSALVKQAVAASVDHLLANDLLGALDFSSDHDEHGTDGHGSHREAVKVKLAKASSKSGAPTVTHQGAFGARRIGGSLSPVQTSLREMSLASQFLGSRLASEGQTGSSSAGGTTGRDAGPLHNDRRGSRQS
jgi:hypothetical protein